MNHIIYTFHPREFWSLKNHLQFVHGLNSRSTCQKTQNLGEQKPTTIPLFHCMNVRKICLKKPSCRLSAARLWFPSFFRQEQKNPSKLFYVLSSIQIFTTQQKIESNGNFWTVSKLSYITKSIIPITPKYNDFLRMASTLCSTSPIERWF